MHRVLAALALLLLVAATPDEVLPGLRDQGYYIEEGAPVSENVVSDAVFEARSAGGRLHLVVLATEPPGGATTFSDAVLDRLGGGGYVLTVARETVGWAGDGSFWTADEMDRAVDASLDADSDDRLIAEFTRVLTGAEPGTGDGEGGGGGLLGWVLLIAAVGLVLWMIVSRRGRSAQLEQRLKEVKGLAREKLAQVANDILEMEDEVALSDNPEVRSHYQKASETYTEALEETETATTVAEMIAVSNRLDLAIWELDSAEALLDGKPKPPRPQPTATEPVVPPPAPGEGVPVPGQGTVPPPSDFERRPQRQSTGVDDLLSMLMTMMMMGGMRGPGGFGGGGFGGSGRGTWTGGGGGRIRMGGGGRRFGGGGRIRGGGRRRG